MRDLKWLAREYLYRLFVKKRTTSFQKASKEKDNKAAISKDIANLATASGQVIYFSRRELKIVSLYLKGYGINHIAEILLLSPKTIEFYLRNASARLTVKEHKEAEG